MGQKRGGPNDITKKSLGTRPRPQAGFFSNMAKAENQARQEKMYGPQLPPLGVLLDTGDLHELRLRSRARRWNPGTGGAFSRGALSIPIREWDDPLQESLEVLKQKGRVTVKDHQSGQVYADSGNRVLRFETDPEVEETVKTVNMDALSPIFRFMDTHPDMLESAFIYPNATVSGKINGAVLTLNGNQKEQWKAAAQLQMALGRGIQLSALPMGVLEFWERSHEILPVVHKIAKATGGVKYVQFSFDQGSEQVFMSVAQGPKRDEIVPLNAGLASLRKGAEAGAFIGEVNARYARERQQLTETIVQALGIPGSESVSNTPYIGIDPEANQVYSGAVLGQQAENGLSPLTVANSEIIIHRPSERIVPVGTASGKWTSKIEVPQGYTLPDPPKGQAVQIFDSVKASLTPELNLHTTALAYHSKLRRVL